MEASTQKNADPPPGREQNAGEEQDAVEEERAARYATRILKGSGSVFSGSMVGKVVGFVLNLVLTRGLGPALYGLYTLGLTVLRLARETASLGLQNGIVRFGAPHYESGEPDKLKGTILAGGGFGFIAGVAVAAGLFLLAPWLAERAFGKPDLVAVIQIFACGLPFYVFTYLASRMARALGAMRADVTLDAVLQPGLFLLLVSGVFLAGWDFSAALYAFLASTVLAAGTSAYVVYQLVPDELGAVRSKYEIRRLLRFSLPIIGISLTTAGLSYTDRLMLGGLASDSAVGIYQAAASMSNQMRFGLSAVSAAFSPLVADLYQSGKLEALRRIYADTVRWVALITLPVAVILFVFAPVIMSIYGSAFSEGGDLLRILTMANLVVVGVGSVGYVLQMSDHQDFVLVVNLFMATLNIGLNWLLIRSYGASGAAAATGFTQALGNTVQVIALYRFTGVQPFRWALWKPVVAAGVAGLGAWGVQALLPNPAAWLVGIPTAGLLYLGTALGLGLHPKDQSVVEALWTRVRRGASS